MKNNLLETINTTANNWWISLVIGILSLLLGVIFIFQPLDILITFPYIFMIFFFVAGIFEIVLAISNKSFITGWGLGLVCGILDIMAGVMLLFIPPVTTLVMAYFIGFWIMFQSIWGIGISSDLQRIGMKGWGWLLFLSILCLSLSFVFLISPVLMSEFNLIIAAFAFIVYGIFRIYLSIKFK